MSKKNEALAALEKIDLPKTTYSKIVREFIESVDSVDLIKAKQSMAIEIAKELPSLSNMQRYIIEKAINHNIPDTLNTSGEVESPYGEYCPECGMPGINRERRIGGKTFCKNKHGWTSGTGYKKINIISDCDDLRKHIAERDERITLLNKYIDQLKIEQCPHDYGLAKSALEELPDRLAEISSLRKQLESERTAHMDTKAELESQLNPVELPTRDEAERELLEFCHLKQKPEKK